MKTLTTLLLTLLVLGGCSQEPKYDGLWLIDREQTKANCEAIFQETNNANEEFSYSNEEDSSDFDWAEAFGKALESLLCSGAEVIFPVLDIKENSFSLSVFGAELLCKIDENANNVDCTNQTKITDVITNFEPRVLLTSVEVVPRFDENQYEVIVEFYIQNAPAELVDLSFTLERLR